MRTSVAICTYNGEKFIRQQLESIINQTLRIDEIIICDDASTDNTLNIIAEISNKFPGLIFIFKNKGNLGTIKNFEKAISLTTGDIIFLSDQDDIWKFDKVQKITELFQKQPKALLVFTDGELVDQNEINVGSTLWVEWGFSELVRRKWCNNKLAFEDLLMSNNKVTGATLAFKKALKDFTIPIEVPFGYWHDAYLALNASAMDGLFFIEECLIDYRIHETQQVGIPESSRENLKNNNFIKPISYLNFIWKIFKKYNSLTLRIKIVSVLVKKTKSKLYNDIIIKSVHIFTKNDS